jgi:cystathionine beta-lyase/cystathionine gamma-synthase
VSARPAAPPDLLAEALADLGDDLDALAWLAGAGRDRLDRLGGELAAVGRHLPGRTLAWLETERRRLRSRQAAHARRLERLRDEARAAAPGERLRAQLAQAKAAHADLLRAERAALAGLVVAADWQSPSFGHAVRPAAGRRTGAIVPHVDDYTRDRHADAAEFEAAWVADVAMKDLTPLLTSCGMAAVTTVLGWLGPQPRGALLGRGVYHETRDLIRGPRTVVDETDTAALLAAIDARRPALVVLDSIGNAAGMPAPDLDAVVAHLRDRGDVTLLIDNTACSIAWTPPPAGGLRLVVIESLIKHAQLGLDRAPAGLILAAGPGTEALDAWREHLGTNITDYAAVALPPPNRELLLRRLRRLERNASLLAARVPGAAHPSLPAHHAFARALPFRGSFLTIETPAPERFVDRALEAARAAKVPLHAGTSFGLDVTRVYAPIGPEPRFARIAAGTEDRLAIEAVAAVGAQSLRVQR